ncbi:MAG: hypothetical protein VX640_08720 [Pseudomonadota bacterium]|nr:hypothetical protein [Pseudomonadota bacterium]
MISRIATSLVGLLLMVYGVIAAISPLPAGVLLIVLGAFLIALANPAARPLIRRLRERWGWFDRLTLVLGKRAPEKMKSVIEETAPDGADEEPDRQ